MYEWDIEVVMYGNAVAWVHVKTKTEDWYEAERAALDQTGVWDIGMHYTCTCPDGSTYGM